MIILRSLASAFLMYSRIPFPKVEWREENRRYALCFFPLIGAVIGGLLLAWNISCGLLGIGNAVRAAVSVLLPVIITGGIHIDGFCDTVDAVSSYADRSKRLEIMKDPHIGSFAVISLCSVFLLQFALFCEIKDPDGMFIIAVGYIFSRSLSGTAAVTFRSTKKEGSLQSFVKPAHRKITVGVLIAITALCGAAMMFTDLISGAVVWFSGIITFLLYGLYSYRVFGGITGDTEGWFLQITETVIPAVLYITKLVQLL